MMRRVLSGVAFAMMLACSVASAARQVTFISDIHYDPQYGTVTAFGKCSTSASSVWDVAGCDASPQLTQRSLDDVSAQNTSFIFFGGDWQRHGFSSSGLAPAALFTDLAERFRNVTVDGSLGEVAFVGSLGNNDVVPDYYFAWESAASEEQLAYRVQALETVGLLSATEARVMARCGYYTHEMGTLNVIVLHTLLWAYRLEPSLTSSVEDPCDQLAFLEAELAKVRAAGKRSVIVGHIPPSLNTFTVLQKGFRTIEGDMYWKPFYQTAYDAIISDYKDVVATQLFGHTHRFAPLLFSANGVNAFIVPAISPVYNNRPSYLLTNFSDDGWVLEDLQIRYLTPDGEFHAGMFVRESMNFANGFASMEDARASVKAMATDDVAWNNYMDLYGGGEFVAATLPHGSCDIVCRHVLLCSMLENQYEAIKTCVADFAASSAPAPAAETTTTTTTTTTSTTSTAAPTTTSAAPDRNGVAGSAGVTVVLMALAASITLV